ncbi:uncharacterized protein BDV17DRAFT_289349 [Aspergillus undulatus]|uniref:uncharacterized protein n=1 Tax=Aspergillus undulatus TaxID=1810928 RepID=UPI003CCD09F8
MAAVNRNMFDACVALEKPQGPTLLVLPLNLIAQIVACLDDAGDLARLCRSCRVLNYMALPQLYKNLILTSYNKIRYRGDEPEGMGSASPFTMGLNAIITRPYALLVRSLTLRGDWRELELDEHARVGRVPDSSMMLNITVRAAVDRMQDLESFSWELSTKMLETVYLGLAQLPKLTSLTIRFPSSRHPRPTTVIPAMPHLRYLKITDIDPLCYPDDISTLLWKARKLRELKMHWSPRMRNMQEPSVMLHDYFRKCILMKQPLTVKKLGMANMYARHSDDFMNAFSADAVEEVTMLNEIRGDGASLNTFVDNTWPVTPHKPMNVKSLRANIYNPRQSEFLGSFTGLEKLYLLGATGLSDGINSPRELASASCATTLTPPASDTTNCPSRDLITPSSADSPSSLPSFHARIRDNSINNIVLNHAATLRHLLLPARWALSSNIIARIVHASPQLEQLAFAAEFSSMDTMGLLLPFLRNLKALRLLIPTGTSSDSNEDPKPPSKISKDSNGIDISAESLAEFVDLDDEVLIEILGENLADQQLFQRLKVIGIGRKGFVLGDYYTVPMDSQPRGVQSQTPTASRAPSTDDQSPLGYSNLEQTQTQTQTQTNGVTTGAGLPSPGLNNNHTQTNSPKLPNPPFTQNTPTQTQPPSSLGKRMRDEESSVVPLSQNQRAVWEESTENNCLTAGLRNRTLRRRVQRVGWDVLKKWEIWGMDTHQL